MHETPKTVDITPTWRGIMPALIAVLQNGTLKGQDMARAELMRLADIVDQQNAHAKTAQKGE